VRRRPHGCIRITGDDDFRRSIGISGKQICTVSLAAQRYLRYLGSQRFFRTNCIRSIKLRTHIKAEIFPFDFSILAAHHQGRELFVHLLFHFFFAEMTFLAAHAGGHPSGCPHRAGLILKKRKKGKKNRESVALMTKKQP
jgi:hypothetical protein